MSDIGGLRAFIKQSIERHIADHVDFETSFREAVSGGVYQKDSMTVDEFVDEVAEDVQTEIMESVDLDALSEKVARDIAAKALTFRVHPAINGNRGSGFRMAASSLSCPTCYRPHGEWNNESGISHDPNILTNGRVIIVLDDF